MAIGNHSLCPSSGNSIQALFCTKNEADFWIYTTYYYESGSPCRAPEMLEHYLSELPREEHRLIPMLYFFGRVAQGHPQVIREYEVLFQRAPNSCRHAILRLLGLAGDDQTRKFLKGCICDESYKKQHAQIKTVLETNFPMLGNALLRPVRRASDLDLLWAEFIITGNKQAVVRIIDVLDWPDLLRQKLRAWLKSKPAQGFLNLSNTRRKRSLVQLQEATGIECDAESNEIPTGGDLDCVYFHEASKLDPRRAQQLLKTLPFSLSAEEINHIGVKGVAKWSLASNAQQHPPVLETCAMEVTNHTGAGKLALLEIVIRNYLAREDYLRAAQKLQEYMQFNTSFAEVKAKFQLEVPWGNLADLMNLSIDRTRKESYRRARQLLGGRTGLIDKENEQQESSHCSESIET